jgi:hypothetical protein
VREGDEAFEALRDAIDAFAAERAPELVAEARVEAVAKVRSMLAEAMAQSLLEHSAAATGAHEPRAGGAAAEARPHGAKRPRARRRAKAPGPAPPPAAPIPRRRDSSDVEAERGLYVYGVVAARDAAPPRTVEGVAGDEPYLIEDAGLAAIASRVSLAEFGEEELHENLNDVAWLEATARAHERVLDEALARMTVVPLRLCTIYRGEDQVREMLAREHALLLDALGRLEGKTEWGVKLIAEEGALARTTEPEDAGEPPAAGSDGAAYLERRRREARSRESENLLAEKWAEDVHARLAVKASEALLNPLQRPEVSGHEGEMLLNGVYLVEDAEAEDFCRLVDELDAEYRERGAEVELTGPWPPYNFVKGSIEAAR